MVQRVLSLHAIISDISVKVPQTGLRIKNVNRYIFSQKIHVFTSCNKINMFLHTYTALGPQRIEFIHSSIHSFICQCLYDSLFSSGLFFSYVIFFKQTVGFLGRGISPSQGRYLHTGQHKHRIDAHRHPCLE
jgi:hypothetical protein